MDNLVHVTNLSITQSNDEGLKTLVEHISFDIKKDEIIGVSGRSGSGKSITGRSLMGLLTLAGSLNQSGSIRFDNRETTTFTTREWQKIRGKDITIIFQHPHAALNPLRKCFDQLTEVISQHQKLSASATQKLANDLLSKAGLQELSHIHDAYPHQLSGGQAQRLAICMAMANSPRLIIADEPTSSLDPSTSTQVLDVLTRLVQHEGCALLLISHDMEVMKRIANRIIIIEKGRIQRTYDKKNFDQLLFHTSQLEYVRKPVSEDAQIVFKCDNIYKSFHISNGLLSKQHKLVLNGISFCVKAGEMLGITGPSGSGKSTLAAIIAGLEKPDSGIMMLDGKKYNAEILHTESQLRKTIQLVLQDGLSSLHPYKTIRQQWEEVLRSLADNNSVEHDITQWAKIADLESDIINKRPSQISGGQAQRAALIRHLMNHPKLIIFDESLSALDHMTQDLLADFIVRLQERTNFAGIFISHDQRLIEKMCHRYISLPVLLNVES
ncbi:MAG: ATP-binding cassette domain-containing protein [Chitinophagales bacterium]|nr:ATP-binding cassette domain-containing protein [Chitinophagales bacterium]